jgi:hypothetical protein
VSLGDNFPPIKVKDKLRGDFPVAWYDAVELQSR